MMNRRTFLCGLTLGTLTAPHGVEAQQAGKVARIGYLSVAGGAGSPLAEAFRQGLRELGHVEGKNTAIEFRAAEGSDRLPALAAELVQLQVDVIVAFSTVAAQAAKNTTTTVPIVMVSSGDPVGTGLVASLARPGGNITGLSGLATELSGKRLELLREAVPSLSRVAVLWNSLDGGMTLTFRGIQAAARALGVTVQVCLRVNTSVIMNSASGRSSVIAAMALSISLASRTPRDRSWTLRQSAGSRRCSKAEDPWPRGD